MTRSIQYGLLAAAIALSSCTAQQAADAAGCAAAVQKAVAADVNASNAQKAFDAGQAAAATPACVGLSADLVAAFANLPSGSIAPKAIAPSK